MADRPTEEIARNLDQPSDAEVTQQTRFSESIDFEYDEDSEEDIFQCVEPIERSCKPLDSNSSLRFFLLMCLRNVPPFPSDKTELMTLFETKDLAPPTTIENFRETYSPNKAILFYTRDAFIYENLNIALRTTNIRQLLPFRFIFQDICNQLRELMVQETDDQMLTVYRGQRSSFFEIADLFMAYYHRSSIMNTTFFSTSKDREYALAFLRTANADVNPFNIVLSLILFKITARKQDASPYFPFADISKMSNHHEEKEVLFAPGQMFNIDNFDVISEDGKIIFLFEMTLNNQSKKNRATPKSIWDTEQNLFLALGMHLTAYKRFDEAKELYNRLLSEYDDKDKKYACYQGLYDIALAQNDENEAKIIDQKMMKIKFGIEQHSTDFIYQSINREDSAQLFAGTEKVKSMCARLSLNRPMNELISYMQSDEYRRYRQEILDSIYPLAKTFMKNGIYDQAIITLECKINNMKQGGNISSDPLLLPRCYMQLGHCYRALQLNDKSLKNYKLTLEQNIQLPLEEYIELLIGFGKVLEATNNYEEALYKYIEVAEIYQNDLTIGGLEARCAIEECIRRVILHLIPMD